MNIHINKLISEINLKIYIFSRKLMNVVPERTHISQQPKEAPSARYIDYNTTKDLARTL